jgi:Leucine-rich repeat (LRR) protein
MTKLFTSLKNLVRLDLSNNRIKSKLRRVLSAIEKPLQYLKLAGCGLALTDLTYLSMSHHTQGLQELDISENGLGLNFGTVLHLLRNIQRQVRVLELEDTSISDNNLDSLNISLKLLPVLMYLNISGNSLLSEKLHELGMAVAGLEHLQYICMSYPRDCYLPDVGEEQDRLKGEFGNNFGHIIFTEQERRGITNKVPTIVLTELDQDMDQL